MSEEKVEKNIETVPEQAQSLEETAEETIAETESSTATKKRRKQQIVKEKIAQAQERSRITKEQIELCMQEIDSAMDELNSEKEQLFTSALHPAESLLKEIGTHEEILASLPQSSVELLDPEEDEVEIQEPSSGRFKGIVLALIAGMATFMGWAFAASNALGLPIPPEKMPDFPRLNKMLEWTSAQLGQGSNATIGAAAVIVAVLLVMWIIYSLVVAMRTARNLRIAEETEEAVSRYCTDKEECKQKMEQVKEHIHENTQTLAKFKVLLEEQNAKIRRALFLEDAEEFDALHALTKADIATTQHLVDEVKKLLQVPISEAGVLTQSAQEALKQANKTISDHVLKLYR